MDGDLQFVTFRLAAETFAVPVSRVGGILDYQPPAALPQGPHYLVGLLDLRGRITPVVDLRLKLGLSGIPPTPATRILALETQNAGKTVPVGAVVDCVLDVTAFDKSEIEEPPEGAIWHPDYLLGVARRGGLIMLIDIDRLLADGMLALAAAA